MSRVLGRLRELLDDPVFIRQGQHLQPTLRAIEVNDALRTLQILLSPSSFNAKLYAQQFVIATTDYAMQTILPYALLCLDKEAPNISLQFIPLKHDQLNNQLSADGCDMAIGA